MQPTPDQVETARPYRIYAVGDSNCLALRDLLATVPHTRNHVLFYSNYVGGLFAKHVWTAETGLHANIKSMLATYALIDKDDEPLHLSYHTDVHSNIFASGQALIAPIFVIIAGDIDLRNDIYPMLIGDVDVIAEEGAPYGLQPNAQILPSALLEEELALIVGNLVAGAVELQERYGFRVFLHAVNPPTLDEERIANIMKFALPANKRYKITCRYNAMLQAACHSSDVGYVDIWAHCTTGGYLRPEYELDGVHLSPETTQFTIKRLLEVAETTVRNKTNEVRYRMVGPRAANRRPTDSRDLGEDEEDRLAMLVHTNAGEEFRAAVGRAFEHGEPTASGISTHRLDWVTATEYDHGTDIISLCSDALNRLWALLSSETVVNKLNEAIGSDFMCPSCRGIDYSKTGSSTSSPRLLTSAPKHVVKAVLGVDNTTRVSLEDRRTATLRTFDLEHGDLVVYNPSRYVVEIHSQSQRYIDLTLLARLAGQKVLALSSGCEDWPADPFHFSIEGMRVVPQQTKDYFSAPSIVYSREIGGEQSSDYTKENVKETVCQSTAIEDRSDATEDAARITPKTRFLSRLLRR